MSENTGRTAICYVGDIGGAKQVLAPMQQLVEKDGWKATWFVDTHPQAKAGTDVLAKANITYAQRAPHAEDFTGVDILVVGASVTANTEMRAWTDKAGLRGIKVVVVEDSYGAFSRESPELKYVNPHAVLTIDSMAADYSRLLRPDVLAIPVGKAAFDDINDLIAGKAGIRSRVRDALHVGADDILVVYWSMGDNLDQTEREVHAIVGTPTLALGKNVRFVVRFHPKISGNERVAAWNKMFGKSPDKYVQVPEGFKPAEHLNFAADLVFGGWGGTEALRTALAEELAAVPVYHEDYDRRVAAGHRNGLPPHLMCGAVLPVSTPGDLRRIVSLIALGGREMLRKTCVENLGPLNVLRTPGATDRIAKAIKGIADGTIPLRKAE